MPFPFEFHLETLPPFQIVYNLQEICRDEITAVYRGRRITKKC